MSTLSENSLVFRESNEKTMSSSIITNLFQIELGNVQKNQQLMSSTISSLSNIAWINF